MNRLLREERGSVFVLSAFVIPVVFLVLLALVVDTGIWFTHKRQLQNRADAAALAAGVEYGRNWAACGSTVEADKLLAANAIDSVARQYAGDPDQATRYNTEVTDDGAYSPTSRINVEVNSSDQGSVDPGTSWNDYPRPAPTTPPTPPPYPGPCDPHPTADRFSKVDTYYVDVGVREHDQRTFMGMFGANLLKNDAHARVELEPAAAGKGFIPVALPEQDIQQAQLRYYEICGNGAPTLLPGGIVPLQTLKSTYQTNSGTTYWGPAIGNGDPVGLNTIEIPAASDCPGQNYIRVSAELRIAGVDSTIVDIDTASCAALVTARFADCWPNVSTIRVFKDDPQTEPFFQEAEFSPGSSPACGPDDAYFSVVDDPATSCRYTGWIAVNWNVAGAKVQDVDLSIGGVAADGPGGPTANANGVWTMSTEALDSTAGSSNVTISWCVHVGHPNCRGGDPQASGIPVHALFKNDPTIAPVVDMVRTSLSPWQTAPPQPGPGGELHWIRAANGPSNPTIYPTVALESSLYVGQRRVLRASGPQSNQSVDCEPATGGQGHDFQMFATGCDPWYTDNKYAGPPWWFPGNSPPPGNCPDKNGILAQPNSEEQPYQCVVKAPGFSPPVIGDGIAAAIGNCDTIVNNSCNRYVCNNPNYYDPADPDRWALELQAGVEPPRVVFLFIVPYGAYKNTGPQEGMPVKNFAAFYVTGWHGTAGNSGTNPCEGVDPPPDAIGDAGPDETMPAGSIAGYFVDYVTPSAPGDPNAPACKPNQLRPCVPVLVR